VNSSTETALNVQWLLRVRWFVWAAQSGLVLWEAVGLKVQLEAGWLTLFLALGFLSNASLVWWQPRRRLKSENLLLGIMLLDVLLHTMVFFFSGGPFNPFTALYLVNVVLGTLVLSQGRQWIQLSACFTGFSALFVLDRVAPAQWHLPQHAELMKLHVTGMLVAFAVSSAFIIASMARVLVDRRRRDLELTMAKERALQLEKRAALTTLAAGAAHELATPLGTITIASRELAQNLGMLDVPLTIKQDAVLIFSQAQRCRDILIQLSAASGEMGLEGFSVFSIQELLESALAPLTAAGRLELGVSALGFVRGPKRPLIQALNTLVRNAQQASAAIQPIPPVRIESTWLENRVVVTIQNQGPVIEPAILRRIGEPFFTTRPSGEGLGLGVYLARNVAEQLSGSLTLESSQARGTVATLTLPLEPTTS
jgi:two-component system, sensor histidine kinase RegB